MKRGLLLFLIILPLCAMGQDIKIKKIVIDKNNDKSNTETKFVASEVKTERDDTVYCSGVVRRYQWYEGRDSITKDVAYHLPCYFRLSMKNDAGHWQHVEAMCGDTMTTGHSISHYVLDKRYDGGTSENSGLWAERLSAVTQWLLTAGLDGNTVVEERAYDKYGDMVYSYLPTRDANGRVIACYNNQWGMPVDMDEQEDYTYGSVVRITPDRWGYDSIIDFLDGQGLCKPNPNGADQQRYQYDSQGRIIKVSSHNLLGDAIIDNWGNHATTYEYLPGDTCYVITTIDTKGEPMRMPEKRADATRTFIKCRVSLDQYGRIRERQMIDALDNNDATSAGINRIEYDYTEEKGRCIATIATYFNQENQVIITIETRHDGK